MVFVAARPGFAFAVVGATLLGAGPAHAHFVLQAPAANLGQNAFGDPQKDSPCGGAGTETGMVTAYQAGDTVTITVDETIFHPGHFRVALAINDPSELPPEPVVTPGSTPCGTVEIMDPPQFPVLADGMLLHTEPFADAQSFDVQLPDNVSCDACTLQVLMFMQQHDAPCFYHHCATISIAGGADGSSDGGSATAGVTDSASTGDNDDSGGCGCTTASPPPVAAMLGLLGMLGPRRRRR